MGVLTTGFNAPAVDLIAMLRPTKSTGLYVQMAGRGTRLAPGKDNCLVLDFAGNVARHGPIDLVKPRDKANGEGDGEAPTKVCPRAGPSMPWRRGSASSAATSSHAGGAARGHRDHPTDPERRPTGVGRRRRGDLPPPREAGQAAVPSGRLPHCGLVRHREWVCLEHGGYAGRGGAVVAPPGRGELPPATVDEALARATASPASSDRGPPERPVHGGRPCEVRMSGSSGLCAVCRRGSRGFGWFDARFALGDRAAPRASAGSARSRVRTSAIGGGA